MEILDKLFVIAVQPAEMGMVFGDEQQRKGHDIGHGASIQASAVGASI
jgi:hypothetical protein